MKTYEDFAAFWIDDAAYQVGRGTRYLALAGETDRDVSALCESSAEAHGVLIRVRGAEVQVAAAQWVFDLLDANQSLPRHLLDALTGALLGYSADKIAEFCQPYEVEK